MHSPQILMLSGIGPAAHLTEHDIPIELDLPGVGQNLKDHPIVETMWRLNSGSLEFIRPDTGLINSLRALGALLRWLFTKTGSMLSNVRLQPSYHDLRRLLTGTVDPGDRISCVPPLRRPQGIPEGAVSRHHRGLHVWSWRTRSGDHMYTCWPETPRRRAYSWRPDWIYGCRASSVRPHACSMVRCI